MVSFRKSSISSIGIVVIAAILVEILSIMQYERVRKLMREEMDTRSRVVLESMKKEVEHLLERTEVTMKENLWDVRRSLVHPDSSSTAMIRLIDDNENVVGGCLAFVPDYYPSKGRLFEPYAHKENGRIVVSQIAGPDHDYTRNEEYIRVVERQEPNWTDAYTYGPDSLDFATYSYPVWDDDGRLSAVCGLDIDLSWLGDTLNARQPYPSSFGLLLTTEGLLVASPSATRTRPEEVQQVLDILKGAAPASINPAISIQKTVLDKDPYWQLIQVYSTDELFGRIRRMRRQQMLFILLGLAILAFMINRFARNERHLREASAEQARIGGELAVARNIQREMIPVTFPPFIYGTLDPAREVGGDIYDFFIRDGKLFFCIGDVSGKGVPAAMLMSVIHSLFRMMTQKVESPSRVLQVLNAELCRSNDCNMFVTFFLGCLDLYSGEMVFANAGHDKPFVMSDDIALLPTKSNLPLGVFPDTHFEEQSCTLAPGTTLILYTDGLTEAKNLTRNQFGRPGVTGVLKSCQAAGNLSPETLVSSLCEAAQRFADGAPQSDDLTMLVVRFDPGDILQDEIELENKESEITRLSAFTKGFCEKLALEKKPTADLRLALEEAVVNVIDYAYPYGERGSITIKADSNHREVRFTIIDSGIPFDPTSVLEADTTLDAQNRPIGGLGILLSRKLTDSVSYARRNGQNVLTLTKSIV